ncbi:MAG: 16S rRNA (cytosine(1402)-N(4))-methyltransferase [Candidatus Doudnabacteria bacterium RIFCSPHIGHO2_01_52_17]|uniref:Ribosomal RNA small subunit methyltransferase H n=1 Tax=Candidatus Doudnabacteria bacterium RIFCSPHIGHO2_01_52_17 TaxID=1817820 RepID=A0A1F5NC07_9BACT|nr:MAG: Ribosomal RNA small subunit methyltransferase H [Parcubacteria group bacterium GW2011_GWA2_52_8]OGE75124.1 MAG: 16S rRNA (cytosine(1402)-N(4))-methyltransferase [Candidatus Doudnabacteria bacterium RIFCSPHIGHO2_01_52_17]
MKHIPVLYNEVLRYFAPQPGQKFIDATAGGGGHIRGFLDAGAFVLGLDRDPEAIANLKQFLSAFIEPGRLTLAIANFSNLSETAASLKFDSVQGVLFDLGLSSEQLDTPERGFAFQKDGPLDMRFSQKDELTAASLLQSLSEAELVKTFVDYGEERRFGRKIARAVVKRRAEKPIVRTAELFELIKLALPGPLRYRAGDAARRIFQSLRIAVNKELDHLRAGLPQALEVLAPGGKLAVISFHSLEDRIVKTFFSAQARQCVCPPAFPICQCGGNNARLKILTKKPVTASPEETQKNPRSHSAKLRVAEKIK